MDQVAPVRCPYCSADAPPHWSHWGSYQRYSGDPEDPSKRVAVSRYRCRIKRRTFSLLPDGLLPYCSVRAGSVLTCLHALLVQKVALNTLARSGQVARSALRSLRSRFAGTVSVLRLPEYEGALSAAAFLEVLLRMEGSMVVALFRNWKEYQPKHSVVGIYAR